MPHYDAEDLERMAAQDPEVRFYKNLETMVWWGIVVWLAIGTVVLGIVAGVCCE